MIFMSLLIEFLMIFTIILLKFVSEVRMTFIDTARVKRVWQAGRVITHLPYA